jgi:hypothetical protein
VLVPQIVACGDMGSGLQFPVELVQRKQWCLWKIEPDKNGRPTKVPYRPDGRKASTTDPRTWSAFSVVSHVLRRRRESFGGIGYFFAADDSVCGVDLDVSLDDNANPQPWAKDIIDRFQDTYRAFSVSGCGLHILCRAGLPGKGRNFYVPNGPTDPSGKRPQIGIYDRARFFALTGRTYQRSTLELADHQQTITWLLGLMRRDSWMKPTKRTPATHGLTDSEIIGLARRARNSAKFERLWAGNWQIDYGSQSEADLALCCILAFWCGPNPSRIEMLFRQSNLAREKWMERHDYREGTIQLAIERTSESYTPRKRRSLPTAKPPAGASSRIEAVREICIGGRQLHEMSRDVLAALQDVNEPPELFARSGRMVAIVRDERKRHVIAEVTEAALRGRMARSAFYYKLGKNQERIECLPPLDVVRDILALSPAAWKFPPLEGLIEASFLRPDGTICDRSGYDASTCLFYAPAPGFQVPQIPETPTRDHVDVSLELLGSAIDDFPFADDASRANAIASMLTPLVRPAIQGPTPLALYDAPQAGTGKTLLAEVVSIIATGRPAETFSAPTDKEEWRKKITTVLSAGTSVVVIDNVSDRLDSDSLCSALTGITVADRVFGTFEQIVLPVKCAWIATGNNMQLGGDMPRRCYWIRLDAKQSQPFRRTGFHHADLRGWVTEHRGLLIASLMTIARYWYRQGRPEPKTLHPMGSFEAWCTMIGGILELVGLTNFLGNSDTIFEQADSDAVQWEFFLLELSDIFEGEAFRVMDIVAKMQERALGVSNIESKSIREALPDFLAEAADRTAGFFQRRLGRAFAQRLGRRYGESQVYLGRAEKDRKAKVDRWMVVNPAGGITNPASQA